MELPVIFAPNINPKNKTKMKKVFAILAVAGFMASCSSGADKEKAAADSTKAADSIKAVMTADSAKAAMDTAKAAMDTAKAKMDTTKKM